MGSRCAEAEAGLGQRPVPLDGYFKTLVGVQVGPKACTFSRAAGVPEFCAESTTTIGVK